MSKYYNGVLLPEIPADVLENFPYCWINNTGNGLICSAYQWYYASQKMNIPVSAENRKYTLSSTGDEWILGNTYTDTGGYSVEGLPTWSSHDILNGSATSTTIYFQGSDPISENEMMLHIIDFNDSAWAFRRPDVFSVTDGTTPFFVNSTLPYDGKSTFRSGAISDGGTSETTITFSLVESGSIELNYAVSSEQKYDWFYIYVDDVEVIKQSGSVSWTIYRKALSAGNHTLKFKYIKDGSQSRGSDAGAIGYVKLIGVAVACDRKYLIQSGDSLFTVVEGVLTAVEGSVNADLFRTYGSDEIPSSDLLTTLTDPVVLYWVDTTEYEIDPLVAVVHGVPPAQILESEDYDMTHETILGIEKVIVDASDDCLFAVSFDAGQTWKMFAGTAWETLSEGDTGMSPSVLSAIPTEDWNLEATTGRFRFRITLPSVDSYLNSLVVDYLN